MASRSSRAQGSARPGIRPVLLAASLVIASAGQSTARPEPSAGGLSSDNVTYVTTVPFDAGGAPTGARRVGDHLYVAGPRSFSIYDVSEPLSPRLLSITPTGPQFPTEDVDTNGEILLISNQQLGRSLEIWDVEDKKAPVRLSKLSNLGDHTFSCVLGCRYAYGAGGSIVDLRDPSDPALVNAWGVLQSGDGFDVTEVSPGRVVTASRPIRLLDARRDPVRPRVDAQGAVADGRLIHSLRWPNEGRDRFLLVQGETPFSQRCESDSGAFMTWDTRGYRRTHTFRFLHEFRVTNGTVADGNPPANAAGCTTMWFQEHPSFDDGGLVVTAFFEHGTRFLEVDRAGRISQRGYFMPLGGETIAAYWITDEIVYTIDLTRGIDILRFEG